jgi:hypothetical protein
VDGELAASDDWIPLVNPPQRSRVRLLREPTDLFADEQNDYPTARFVPYKDDCEVV